MKNLDLVALACLIVVVFMIVGCTVFLIRELRYNLRYTLFIFISVVVGIGLICIYNYFKRF